MPEPTSRNLSTKQLAAYLGRHPLTITRWARNGWISFEKINARVFIYDLAVVLADMKRARLTGGKSKGKVS